MSAHQNPIKRFFSWLIENESPIMVDTGWQREQPPQRPYPLPVTRAPVAGKSYQLVRQPTYLPPVVPQEKLSIEQINRLAQRLSPAGIAQLSTVKDLKTEQLPDHVLQQMANAGRLADNQQIAARARQMQALKQQQSHHVPLQMPRMPEPACQQLSPEQLPSWLTAGPEKPIAPTKKSGFLLAANEVILSEAELKPDLGEDPEATMQRKAVRKERE